MLDESRDNYGEDGVLACCWTNEAAPSIPGSTIRAVFCVRPGFDFGKEALWDTVKRNAVLCDSSRKIEVLFQDEISVLEESVLDSIHWVIRHLVKSERHSCIPMGARQLVVCEDQFQFDPIGVNHGVERERHVFSASSWFLIF